MTWLKYFGICVLLAACGPSSEPTGGGASGSSSGTSTTVGPTATGPGTTAADSTSASTVADTQTVTGLFESSDTTSDCEGGCFIDFPCNGSEPACVDPLTIETWEEIYDCDLVPGCENACFCEGASCIPMGQQPCEPDHYCVEVRVSFPYGAECLPASEVCGGPEGLTCAADQMCEYAESLCPACLGEVMGCGEGSPLGICVPRPAPEEDCGRPRPGDNQCGCDGVTYGNECERRRAGAALASLGDCPP